MTSALMVTQGQKELALTNRDSNVKSLSMCPRHMSKLIVLPFAHMHRVVYGVAQGSRVRFAREDVFLGVLERGRY